ncbi:hypothetical protein QQ045_031289 [Rhodiola kirilowii]
MSSSNHETSSTLTDETAASCLMLLSKVGESPRDRAFGCKTCGKKFSTFQALGGHRASHKKPKLDQDKLTNSASAAQAKPKSHVCAICGAEFALGQALGGHMRRHRESTHEKTAFKAEVPVLKRVNSKRVCLGLGLELDLNLTPRENDLLLESELKLQLGKRDYEMKMELGRLQEYDLRMQMGKRRRVGDGFIGLVV